MKTLEYIAISLVLVLHNFTGLILYPYKTLRKVSQEKDMGQVGIIFLLVFLYFVFSNIVRKQTLHPFVISSSSFLTFIVFLGTFFMVCLFFFWLSKTTHHTISLESIIATFSFSLFPSIIWFLTTSILYLLLPPPRTLSLLGQGFSMIFLVFSLTLLLWRMILLYLSVRFSAKTDFYTTLFFIVLFMLWFLPYSYGLYYLKVFRIPFI